MRRVGGPRGDTPRFRPVIVLSRKPPATATLYTHTVGVGEGRETSEWGEFSAAYGPKVKELIDQTDLEPVYYTPKAGSVLIWHENLAHGGSPRERRIDSQIDRQSLLCRGAIAFYDSQGVRCARFPPKMMDRKHRCAAGARRKERRRFAASFSPASTSATCSAR